MPDTETSPNQTPLTPTPQPINPPPPTQTPLPQSTPKKKKLWLIIALFVLLLGTTGVLAYKYYQLKQTYSPSPTPTISDVLEVTDPTTNWKTYQTNAASFKYPPSWQLDTNGKHLSVASPKVDLWVYGEDDPMMNECMKIVESKTVNNLMIKKYSKVTTAEVCSSPDTTPREIWVTEAGGDGYQPGIIYSYSSTQATEAEKFFDQILSTLLINPNPTSKVETQEPESYISCGCGCCSFDEPLEEVTETVCLYKSKGESIQDKIDNDKQLSADLCATVGCSLPTKYVYCD